MQHPSHGGNRIWAARLGGCAVEDLLDFSASINPLGPPNSVLSAMAAEMVNLNHYPDPNCSILKQTLSQLHGLPKDWILPGNGVAELLTWIGRELADLDQVCLFSPGFGDYERALSTFGATVQKYSLDIDFDLGQDSGDAFLTPHGDFFPEPGQRWGCILNDPHNPIGQRFDPAWVEDCLHHFEWVVIDEAFIDFLPPLEQGSWASLLQQYPNLIILRSLTKFYSIPGIRVGYVLSHPANIARWQRWRDPWSVNSLALVAAESALRDRAFQHKTWDWLPGARAELFEGLSRLPALKAMPSVANYLLVRYDGSAPELQLTLLKQSHILIRDCMSFATLGQHYFRVAVFTQAENQRLLSALSEALS